LKKYFQKLKLKKVKDFWPRLTKDSLDTMLPAAAAGERAIFAKIIIAGGRAISQVSS
jgi:hypothetical protein